MWYFVPKYRKKLIFGTLRKDTGGILRELCRQQGGGIDIMKLLDEGSYPYAGDETAEVQRGEHHQ